MSAPTPSNWGPLVGITDVDWALLGVLQTWLPTYIAQVASDHALAGSPAAVKRFDNVVDLDELMDHALPAILVVTSKTTKVTGGANYVWEARWRTQVYAVTRGRTAREAKVNASHYEEAVRRCLLQKARQDVGVVPLRYPAPSGSPAQDDQLQAANTSILSGCEWQSSEMVKVPDTTGNGRYLSAGIGTYTVLTDKAAQSYGGPSAPNAAPYGPLPTVSAATTVVEPLVSEEMRNEPPEDH